MLAPDLSPIHFWKSDSDSIEVKLGDLQDLQILEFALNDNMSDLDILSLSPIKDRAVLNLMNRLKRSRGLAPGSVASTRRRIQSMKIARALDDLTCIAETPTRLSICRTGSIRNIPSPVSPGRTRTPPPKPADPELKYLFEVLGAATPYMHTPPPFLNHSKSHPVLQLCSLDKDDFDFMEPELAHQPMSASVGATAYTPGTSKVTRIPTSVQRSLSAPPKRTPAKSPVADMSGRFTSNIKSPGPVASASLRHAAMARSPRNRSLSPRPGRVQASQRSPIQLSNQKSVGVEASPIRTPLKAPKSPVAPRSGPGHTPGYLKPTKNSTASRSPSPVRNLNTNASPVSSPVRRNVPAPASPTAKRGRSPSAAVRNTEKRAVIRTPQQTQNTNSLPGHFGCGTSKELSRSPTEDENLSPNITTRLRGSHVKSRTPPMTNIRKSSVDLILEERAKSNAEFDFVMASCDDILAQLDAVVSKKTMRSPFRN